MIASQSLPEHTQIVSSSKNCADLSFAYGHLSKPQVTEECQRDVWLAGGGSSPTADLWFYPHSMNTQTLERLFSFTCITIYFFSTV